MIPYVIYSIVLSHYYFGAFVSPVCKEVRLQSLFGPKSCRRLFNYSFRDVCYYLLVLRDHLAKDAIGLFQLGYKGDEL